MPRTPALVVLLVGCAPQFIEGTSDDSSTSSAATTDPDPTSGGDPGGDDSSTDPATTDPPPPACGNGVPEDGELCDDGDADETDECTSLCAPPACDDGIVSGDESDVDCGGSCEDCDVGAMCASRDDCSSLACAGVCAPILASCLELHDQFPDLPDEAYNIDPDGDGTPVTVYCDMAGGGWTEAAKDTLDRPMNWSGGAAGDCPGLSDHMLGPLGMGAAVGKTFTLLGVPHTQARVHVDFIIIDSWDNERVEVSVDGDKVGEQLCTIDNLALCNLDDNHCGLEVWADGAITVIGMRNHATDEALVELTSTLDEVIDNEAWGVDAVSVFVR
jgi:hypothetical protein